MFEYQV